MSATVREPVTAVKQPDYFRLPVFDAHFGTSGAFATAGRHDGSHTAVATGQGRVFVASEERGRVYAHDAQTLASLGSVAIERPRGIASYRSEVYVADRVGQIVVLDATTLTEKRRLRHPVSYVYNGYEPLGALKLVGVDVAWNEVWATFTGSNGGGGVTVLDAQTGAIKRVTWHLPNYNCVENPLGLAFGGDGTYCQDYVNAYGQQATTGVITRCRPSLTPSPGVNLPIDPEACAAAVTPPLDPERFGWWDLAVVPEMDAVLAQCRFINRWPLLGLAVEAQNARDLVNYGDCSAAGSQDGIDAVWGMQWMLSVNGDDAGREGVSVSEFSLKHESVAPGDPIPGLKTYAGISPRRRTWRPVDSGSDNHRDVAYQNRELRIDWKGPLTETEWMRGTQCLDYVVSDADIYVVGHRGERWYELARGFQKIELRIDDQLLQTQTVPNGRFCVDTNTIPSGVRRLKLTAYVDNNGVQTVDSINDSLRIDHDVPTGAVDNPGRWVTGTVNVRGSIHDAHSGPATWELRPTRSADGSTTSLCTRTDPGAVAGEFAPDCDWPTADGRFPDGNYTLNAALADKVTSRLGGPNTNTAGGHTVGVDNNAPSLDVSGELREREDLAPIYEDEAPEVLIQTGDGAGSGVATATLLVDGIERARTDSCASECRLGIRGADYTDGQHTVQVVVRDHVGHSTDRSWVVDVERIVDADDAATSSSRSATTVPETGTTEVPEPPPVVIPEDAFDPSSPPYNPAKFMDCTTEAEPANFDVFSLGSSFEGLPLVHSYRRCDPADPPIPFRANFATYIYGNCDPEEGLDVFDPSIDPHKGEASCKPPLEIQSWPICERNPGMYELGITEADQLVEARADSQLHLRGAPAAWYDDEYVLEIYTGSSAVVIFGWDPQQMLRAAQAMELVPRSGSSTPVVPPTSATAGATRLALPIPGGLEADTPCTSTSVPGVTP